MEKYLMIVKKDYLDEVMDLLEHNGVKDVDITSTGIGMFINMLSIDNVNLYLERVNDFDYKLDGWDINTDITFDSSEDSLYLIQNEKDFNTLYDPESIGALLKINESNKDNFVGYISDYYFEFERAHFDFEDDFKNPSHYKHGEYDLITHLADILTEEELRGFLKGNVIKYINRYRDKNGIEDLEKAREYTHRLEEFEKKVKGEDNEFIQ